ncbi:PE family protein [Mycobacterium kansasii]|uniref:PE family protein n=1 Tax=Mycobacterium kansasii TaxID=1768 RepID=UPI000CDD78D3|nr:PE family protein [Mycobacterium kansasii]POX80238.1 PE family protein [Mycobacterium kansasii]POX98292.1 PE family protein [Mycobacterium kansasii]POX98657.1 PE family protein [Mycobacterium kansasii]POY22754.1 PE family protein [Mycobacterium kansasii]POY23755.1 PE family protein [Mycobacterium kansasii]
MSFVIAAPELVQGAAHDLAGLRSSLAEAAAIAAGPTTGIAAAAQDEVSIAIASMFGNFGQEFQVLSAQAQAFHDRFVSLLNTGAGAYLSAEAANVEQTLLGGGAGGVTQLLGNVGQEVAGQIQTGAQAISQAIGGLQTGLGALATGGLPGLPDGLASFGATVAGPYQTLFATTSANLQSLQSALAANPQPLLHQILSNQTGYQQTLATALQSAIQNFPADLATVPADIRNLLSGDPAAVLQTIINQHMGYAQTINTALHSAAQDFRTGAAGLHSAFQAAFQDLATGNVDGAVGDISTGLRDLFLTGFAPTVDLDTGIITITPTGTLGDLIPTLAIPGQMAQNFTNLLPAGSIPAQISQNLTNVIQTATSTTQTLDLGTGALHVGLPLVLALDAIGPAVTTANAFGSSASAVIGAMQTGDMLGAVTALIDAPAVVANGFLNGHATLPLALSVLGLDTTTNIPLGGILTPAETASLTLTVFGETGTLPLSGTAFGGIVPALLTFLPEQLAEAIGAPLPIPPTM